MDRGHELRERRHVPLQLARLVVATCMHQLVEPQTCGRGDAGQRQDPTVCAQGQTGEERRRRADEHAEPVRRQPHQIPDIAHVRARLLESDDVFVNRQRRGGLHRQRHPGQGGKVVEEHRHRRRVGHARVVTDEGRGRQLALEVGRRPHQHRVGAAIGRPPRREYGAPRRLATGTRDQHAVRRNALPRRGDQPVRFVIVDQRRLAVRPEHHQSVQPGAHPPIDVVAPGGQVDLTVIGERGRNRRKHTTERHHFCSKRRGSLQ